jgi:threonine dehydrogenase-like Zn-dependent dehydrogenase
MRGLFFDNNILKVGLLNVTSRLYKNAALLPLSPTRYGRVEEPEIPNPRWIKVKNKSCGICGSDVHFIFMELDPKSFPAATPGLSRKFLGHEMIGEVVEVGREVSRFREGDRVCLRIDWPSCYQMEIEPMCRQCEAGNYMMCENLGAKKLPLVNTGGGFSPYMVMHRTQPYKVPNDLTDNEALLLEPVASAAHGVMKRIPERGDRVLVVGCGTIGLLSIAIAKALQKNAEVFAVARYTFQADMARRMGATDVFLDKGDVYKSIAGITEAKYHEGYFGNKILLGGFDIIYDSVGSDRSLQNALRWVRGGGSLVILGINFRPGRIDYSPIWHQELNVTGMNCHANEQGGKTSFDIAARLLMDKRIDTDGLITHRFPMQRYREAIRIFKNKGKHKAIKIVLDHR